jgi:hypothetical protein
MKRRKRKNNYLLNKDAKSIVRGMGIESRRQYIFLARHNRIPDNIPWHPNTIYKNKGWIDWFDWLGKEKKQYIDFEGARKIVRNMKLKSATEYRNAKQNNRLPSNIPHNPAGTYKNRGWIGWPDWLGKKFRSFEKARKFARKLGLKSQIEWNKYRKSGLRPSDIPSNPCEYYSNKGWTNFNDWLNTDNGFGRKKYSVYDNFFKGWTHDNAYVLGLWFTDGNTDGKAMFSICQNENERPLLEKISSVMRSNYPIYPICRHHGHRSIVIRSQVLVKDLLKKGGKANKSLDIKFPSHIPKKYLPDFIRGCWDGDGSIYYTKSAGAYGSSLSSGSKRFIFKMRKILRKNITDLVGGIYDDFRKKGKIMPNGKKMKKDSHTYSLKFSSNDTRRLGNFMYLSPSDLKIERKYKKFLLAGPVRNKKFYRSHKI